MMKPDFDFVTSGATVQAPAPERKRLLRQALLAERKALSPEALCALGRAVCSQILSLPLFWEATSVLCYYPVKGEIDLLPLAELAIKHQIPVGFPVCDPKNHTLSFRKAETLGNFIPGAYGIPVPPENAPLLTPDEHTLCLTPALGYDKNFYRIGFGGGFYDRFLADFPGVTIGVCAERAILETVFPEPHDVAVSLLATEKRILKSPNPIKKPVF